MMEKIGSPRDGEIQDGGKPVDVDSLHFDPLPLSKGRVGGAVDDFVHRRKQTGANRRIDSHARPGDVPFDDSDTLTRRGPAGQTNREDRLTRASAERSLSERARNQT